MEKVVAAERSPATAGISEVAAAVEGSTADQSQQQSELCGNGIAEDEQARKLDVSVAVKGLDGQGDQCHAKGKREEEVSCEGRDHEDVVDEGQSGIHPQPINDAEAAESKSRDEERMMAEAVTDKVHASDQGDEELKGKEEELDQESKAKADEEQQEEDEEEEWWGMVKRGAEGDGEDEESDSKKRRVATNSEDLG